MYNFDVHTKYIVGEDLLIYRGNMFRYSFCKNERKSNWKNISFSEIIAHSCLSQYIAKCTLFDVYCKIFMFANATKRAMDLEVLIAQITFGFLNINILVGCTVRNFVYSQSLKIIYDFKLTHTHYNKIQVRSMLTLIGMSYESKKNAHFQHHLGTFFKCQINPIDINFHLQISLEFF